MAKVPNKAADIMGTHTTFIGGGNSAKTKAVSNRKSVGGQSKRGRSSRPTANRTQNN